MAKNNTGWRRHALSAAIVLGVAMLATTPAMAGNNDGSIVGHTQPGAQLTVTSPSTGLTRSVTADAKGSYRFPFLPIGDYELAASKDGKSLAETLNITVTLGNATTVNVGEASRLDAITVTASNVVTAVDVTSTESATNITREELKRLPVDQTVSAVAVLAPGVNKGSAGFGGITFGGSSVAENSFYVNGLNVTDFYNRNGFSEAPFAFYQEFQVKTGGYSVEFGRSTGGVVNAVTRSGSNDWHAGVELTYSPDDWQSSGKNAYNADGTLNVANSRDRESLSKVNVFASGPILQDKLFFFLMYEGRDSNPRNTSNDGTSITYNDSGDGFWGGKVDWHINDKNLLELLAFSDRNSNTGKVYSYDFGAGNITSPVNNQIFTDTGGHNWNLTWTSYLTNDLSMKLMYGENDRQNFNRSLADIECNRVVRSDSRVPLPNATLGCTTSSSVISRDDDREAARADFEWKLGDHLVRFGLDHEKNTSDYSRRYPGPGAFFYNVYYGTPGTTIPNGGVVPAGYNAYVRARRNEIAGTFESIDSAYYIEDNWNVTPTFLLNAGLRLDGFDNRDGAGRSYIKTDDMLAPRVGFSWDMKGDGSTKLFGNLGRYFLPVANVINIKQGGGLLDQRTYYAFGGWDVRQRNGSSYAVPVLGPQIGAVDTSQGDGTVGDLRSEVDKDIDPVFQDEAILGFQKMLSDRWSWGVSGTYRKLHNAIDDMEISATRECGGDGYVGFVMANPGKPVTVYGDTNCDGVPDGYLTVNTAKEGWALYDADGNYLGQTGFPKPKRNYSALEFQVDRAFDGKWALNASYVLSWSRGNAEGPVNSDTNFDDTGRTENFDNPWVNYGGYGYLANDHRHQIKVRGTYVFNEHWQVGGNFNALSGGPVTGFGVGDPFDAVNYHSYFICTSASCNDPNAPSDTRQYVLSPRGHYGSMPWTQTVDASLAWVTDIDQRGKLQVKLSVYNLFNQQKTIAVDQDLQTDITTDTNPNFRRAIRFQSPRSAQLTVTATF
jgi:hypothetical protein